MADDPPILPARLLEAREYLGFSVDQVARALSCSPLIIEAIEAGEAKLPGEMLRKLSRLYRRPVAWLQGEVLFQPSPELLREIENLTPGDREAILDFHEFLHDAGPAPALHRTRGDADG